MSWQESSEACSPASVGGRGRASWKVSIRRACSALKVERSLYTYKSRRGDQADLKTRIKKITQTRVRYGYRRVHVLLRRGGMGREPERLGIRLRPRVLLRSFESVARVVADGGGVSIVPEFAARRARRSLPWLACE